MLKETSQGKPISVPLIFMLSMMSACATTPNSEMTTDALEVPPKTLSNPVVSSTSEQKSHQVLEERSEWEGADPVVSPRCRAFLTKADHDAALLSAPTLTASVDEEGDAQVALGYDLMNFRAIGLNRQSAHARCEVTIQLDVAKLMQKLSARSLARKGAIARVGFIDRRLGWFEQIRLELNAAVASEKIKEKSRDKVFKVLSALLERNDGLRAKMQTQSAIEISALPSFLALEQALISAVRHQFQIKSQSDFARNVRLTLNGGYSLQQPVDPDESLETEFFGRAGISIRLGVLTPAWRYGKDKELEAEIDKLYEPGIGALWRITDAHSKNKIAISSLQDKRVGLVQKLSKARKNRSSIDPEDKVNRILSEIDIIKLRSEIVELETNLNVLREAQALLSI